MRAHIGSDRVRTAGSITPLASGAVATSAQRDRIGGAPATSFVLKYHHSSLEFQCIARARPGHTRQLGLPRKMRFGLSEGIVLAASSDGKGPFLLSPDSGAEPGIWVNNRIERRAIANRAS